MRSLGCPPLADKHTGPSKWLAHLWSCWSGCAHLTSCLLQLETELMVDAAQGLHLLRESGNGVQPFCACLPCSLPAPSSQLLLKLSSRISLSSSCVNMLYCANTTLKSAYRHHHHMHLRPHRFVIDTYDTVSIVIIKQGNTYLCMQVPVVKRQIKNFSHHNWR